MEIELEEGSFFDLSGIQREEEVPSTSTPKTGTTQCFECGVKCLKVNYKRHMKIHKYKIKCGICTQFFTTQDLLDNKHRLRNMCDICGRSYRQKSALYEHRRIKHETTAKIFQCVTCQKKFNRLGRLQDHMSTHVNRNSYKCKCGRVYKNRSAFKRHQKDCDGTANHACETCQRQFSCASSLKDHKKSEHQAKNYKCKCGNSYKWRWGLARHRSKCGEN